MDATSRLDEQDRAEVKALAARLKIAVDLAGGNTAVAQRSGIPLRTLNGYLAAESDPKTTKLHRIAEACAVSMDDLMGRISHTPSAVSRIASDTDGGTLPEGFVAVPRLEIRASAGPGRAGVPTDDEEGAIAFRRNWLRSLGIAPGDAQFMLAEGDSMDPTIKDGDLMLLDRGWGRVIDGKIYVFVREGLVSVKRVQTLALGGLQLISDNERYQMQMVRADEMDSLNIEARVKWYGRAI